MASGLLINIMLVVLATLCFAGTIYYYRLDLFGIADLRNYVEIDEDTEYELHE